ncbi:cupin domain-containing protein [Haloarchaeobius amylolyticus]|uniref:cupin domain-containing protein n=1 Tax=Haloarchaeobius amylolyticus TaxID=1198296 RepID=UPI00226E1CB1|nr:cupin domain-containing protein [Haloarchaeobius amylolyticus]
MTGLKTIHLDDLELIEIGQEGTDMDVSASFPFSSAFPASTGVELEGGHTVVYFELEPGKELGTHEDSPEEIVVCLTGEGIEAWAGDAEGTIGAGDLLVIPPMAPHGFRNTGDETARCLGFFSDSTVVGEFEEVVQPIGSRIVKA